MVSGAGGSTAVPNAGVLKCVLAKAALEGDFKPDNCHASDALCTGWLCLSGRLCMNVTLNSTAGAGTALPLVHVCTPCCTFASRVLMNVALLTDKAGTSHSHALYSGPQLA